MKKGLCRLCAPAVAALATLIGAIGSPVGAAPLALHTLGSTLYNSAGKPVILKGVDICSMEWMATGDHILESENVAIHKWHVTMFRLPIAQDFWEGKEAGQTDGGAAYRALVDKIVGIASRSGVYVLVDLHWSDMGQWGKNEGQHKLPDDNTAIAWRSIAARFANNPAVMFDAYNEPHDTSWAVWRNGGMVTEGSTTYHSPGMQGLVNVIRGTGAKNIITVGGLDWSSDLTGIANGYAIDSPNIMYSAHIYPQTGPDWDSEIAVADKYAPIFVGEFGADPTAPYAQFEPKIIAWIVRHGYSATAWSFHPTAGPCLIQNWTYAPTFNEGTYVYSWLNGGPTAPANVHSTGAGGHITLTWNPVPGAGSYDIYRSASPTSPAAAGAPFATGIKATQFVDDAPEGATFYYQVTAVNRHATSGASEERGATVGVAEAVSPPTPSFDLTATVSPSTVVAGSPVTITATASSTSGAPASPILLALRITGPTGFDPAQQTKNDDGIDPGKSKSFTFTWTPPAPGEYQISLGAFGSGWTPKYNWANNIAAVTAVP